MSMVAKVKTFNIPCIEIQVEVSIQATIIDVHVFEDGSNDLDESLSDFLSDLSRSDKEDVELEGTEQLEQIGYWIDENDDADPEDEEWVEHTIYNWPGDEDGEPLDEDQTTKPTILTKYSDAL